MSLLVAGSSDVMQDFEPCKIFLNLDLLRRPCFIKLDKAKSSECVLVMTSTLLSDCRKTLEWFVYVDFHDSFIEASDQTGFVWIMNSLLFMHQRDQLTCAKL